MFLKDNGERLSQLGLRLEKLYQHLNSSRDFRRKFPQNEKMTPLSPHLKEHQET